MIKIKVLMLLSKSLEENVPCAGTVKDAFIEGLGLRARLWAELKLKGVG